MSNHFLSRTPLTLPMSTQIATGDRVKIIALPSYVKTAEPMPMMRPNSVITVGEVGTVLGVRPGNEWAVRLEKGAYLLSSQYFEKVEEES